MYSTEKVRPCRSTRQVAASSDPRQSDPCQTSPETTKPKATTVGRREVVCPPDFTDSGHVDEKGLPLREDSAVLVLVTWTHGSIALYSPVEVDHLSPK